MSDEPRRQGRKKEMGSRGEVAFDPHLEEKVRAERTHRTELLRRT